MDTMITVTERNRLRWGVNLQHVSHSSGDVRESQLEKLAELGAAVGRIGISWARVEETKGTYDWNDADSLVSALERHGIQPLVEVSYTPPWARPDGQPETYGPATDDQRSSYAAYCGALAARYKGRVYAYEIWNEANGGFWKPTPSLANYTKLFVAAHAAIKAEDPQAPVVTTGLAGQPGQADALAWTRDFIEGPGMALADGFGFHPYSNGDGRVSGMLLDTGFVRQALDDAGYAHIPLYLTEAGISTSSDGGVSEDMQATVVSVTGDWVASLHGVNCVLWYCDADSAEIQAADATDPEGYFGLWRVDGSAKPAVAALAREIKKTLPAGTVPASWWSYQDGRYVQMSPKDS